MKITKALLIMSGVASCMLSKTAKAEFCDYQTEASSYDYEPSMYVRSTCYQDAEHEVLVSDTETHVKLSVNDGYNFSTNTDGKPIIINTNNPNENYTLDSAPKFSETKTKNEYHEDGSSSSRSETNNYIYNWKDVDIWEYDENGQPKSHSNENIQDGYRFYDIEFFENGIQTGHRNISVSDDDGVGSKVTHEHVYDGQGYEKSSSTTWEGHTPDGGKSVSTEYREDGWCVSNIAFEYDSNGNKIYEMSITWDGSRRTPLIEVYYDENGHVVEKYYTNDKALYNSQNIEVGEDSTMERYDGQGYLTDLYNSRIESKFDEAGNYIGYADSQSELHYAKDGTAFGHEEKWGEDEGIYNRSDNYVQYQYDKDGNIINSIIIPANFDTNGISFGEQIDINGDKIKDAKLVRDEETGKMMLYVGIFDDNGDFITESETEYAVNGYGYLYKVATKVYDEEGHYKMYDGDGKVIGIYDEYGNQIAGAESSSETTESRVVRRIYTVEEATEAVKGSGKNRFIIRYR